MDAVFYAAAALCAAAGLFGLYLFMIAPARPCARRIAPFLGWRYAHRGLHDNTGGIPENSLAAFEAAAEAGYAIELDVQKTKDGRLVVFHDDALRRMCAAEGEIAGKTLEELTQYTLLGTKERIPEFAEVLRAVGGRVPLLVELKGESLRSDLPARVHALLQGYEGEYLIESFNPLMLRWYKKHAPHILRGQLSCVFEGPLSLPEALIKFAVTHLLTNCLARPSFIAYGHRHTRRWSFRLCRGLFRAPTFVWTVNDPADYGKAAREADTVIFEGFDPPERPVAQNKPA